MHLFINLQKGLCKLFYEDTIVEFKKQKAGVCAGAGGP